MAHSGVNRPAVIGRLASALDQLPGIGPKAAARLAQYLVTDKPRAGELQQALQQLLQTLSLCPQCRSYRRDGVCEQCEREVDSPQELMVVSDFDHVLLALESGWQGRLFVLHGLLSPVNGIGPEDIGVENFRQRLLGDSDTSPVPRQVNICLDETVEGKATGWFLQGLLKQAGIEGVVQPFEDWQQASRKF